MIFRSKRWVRFTLVVLLCGAAVAWYLLRTPLAFSIAKERQALRQVRSYSRLAHLFQFIGGFEIAKFDESAARQFDSYSAIRISQPDRKIAAIAVAQNALLLTANRRDFELIPGLRFENWLD